MRPQRRQRAKADDRLPRSAGIAEPAANILVPLRKHGDIVERSPVRTGIAEQQRLRLRSVLIPLGREQIGREPAGARRLPDPADDGAGEVAALVLRDHFQDIGQRPDIAAATHNFIEGLAAVIADASLPIDDFQLFLTRFSNLGVRCSCASMACCSMTSRRRKRSGKWPSLSHGKRSCTTPRSGDVRSWGRSGHLLVTPRCPRMTRSGSDRLKDQAR
jgi:hypothetical protein